MNKACYCQIPSFHGLGNILYLVLHIFWGLVYFFSTIGFHFFLLFHAMSVLAPIPYRITHHSIYCRRFHARVFWKYWSKYFFYVFVRYCTKGVFTWVYMARVQVRLTLGSMWWFFCDLFTWIWSEIQFISGLNPGQLRGWLDAYQIFHVNKTAIIMSN